MNPAQRLLSLYPDIVKIALNVRIVGNEFCFTLRCTLAQAAAILGGSGSAADTGYGPALFKVYLIDPCDRGGHHFRNMDVS